jgi:hypothetical protein
MKIAAMTLMAAMVGVAAEPKQPQQKLTVYLRENARVPPEVRAPAVDLANKMFATIGIRLDWRSGEPPRTSFPQPIGIELATDTPTNLLPGALGSAMPYEGVHIRVFYDRVRSDVVPRSVLLAHVMVHEIAHILQKTDRHSDGGVARPKTLSYSARQVECIWLAKYIVTHIRVGRTEQRDTQLNQAVPRRPGGPSALT